MCVYYLRRSRCVERRVIFTSSASFYLLSFALAWQLYNSAWRAGVVQVYSTCVYNTFQALWPTGCASREQLLSRPACSFVELYSARIAIYGNWRVSHAYWYIINKCYFILRCKYIKARKRKKMSLSLSFSFFFKRFDITNGDNNR